jgi:diguanylate cyclase (GGDEF)-like protein/PAS domain S-box-containing protein
MSVATMPALSTRPRQYDASPMALLAIEGMLLRCSRDDGVFVFVSAGCAELTGYSSRELLAAAGGRQQLVHPDDRERLAVVIAATGEGERYRLRYSLLRRDGSLVRVRESGVVLRATDGEWLIEALVEDDSAQLASERQRVEAELRYLSMFENSVVGMFQTTGDGRYLAANRALAELYAYSSAAELVGSLRNIAARLYVEPGRRDEFAQLIREHGCVIDFVSEVYRVDGTRIWIAENAHAVRGADGELLYYEGTVEDVTERREYQSRLEHQATHDPLTGLPNRTLLVDRLDQAMSAAQRGKRRVATAFVDLDNFKYVNDSLGHVAGDTLIIAMAERLRKSLRGVDTVARYGGDEFVLVFAEYAGINDTVNALERVQRAIRSPLFIDGRELCIDCSIGISLFPDDGDEIETLLRNANAAMHHAKDLGKGQFQFFTAEMNAAVHQRLALESALRHALDADELSLVYQPKIDPYGGRCGCEALLRWTSVELGSISPERFVPLADETGLIEPITDFVLRTACTEALSWPDAQTVAVNLSARLFRDDQLADRVAAILVDTGLPGSRLELEITESTLLGDLERTTTILERLRALGVRIALDDFGTGYSSLAYLRRLPLDVVKIDRSFVTDCEQGGEAMAIPRAIISLGHSLHLRVIAEGIENPRQLEMLAACGCDEFQGFMIARPLSPDAVRAFLASETPA